jgi:hypothetical protein
MLLIQKFALRIPLSHSCFPTNENIPFELLPEVFAFL